jgi:hypothetical protein
MPGQPNPGGPNTVSIIGKESFSGRDEPPTWQELRLLTGYSASLNDETYSEPPSDWESDPFNAELLSWLPPQPPGHAPLFYRGISSLPPVNYSKNFMLALASEALEDGQGPLVDEQFRKNSQADCSLRKLASDAGIRNSVSLAYARSIGSVGQLAAAFERGQVPSVVAPGLAEFESNAVQFRDAANKIFAQVAQRWAARVYPICRRLKLAAERRARKQAASDTEYAEKFGSEFRASGFLMSCISFGLTSRIGQGGWQGPWFNILELNCALPANPTPWCPDWALFKLPADCESDNLFARLVAQANQIPTSETKQAYLNAQKQSKDNE